jgi:hypothetical protein
MDQEALKRRWSIVAVALALAACDRFGKKPPPPDERPPDVQPLPSRTPQTFDPTPVSAFADASIEGKPPLEQARVYESNGQLWLARLVLEPKALSSDGTKEEATLLGSICARQGDSACLDRCSAKVGKKLSFDAGAATPSVSIGGMHEEPQNDAARARAMLLANDYAGAHKLLEPKLLSNKASKEEIRLLKSACEKEGDQKMCVALCDSKLK